MDLLETQLTAFFDPYADSPEHSCLELSAKKPKKAAHKKTAETGCIQPVSARYVTVARASELTGFSEKAIRKKIEVGKWIVGREYRRTPDNRILIDMRGYERWVERAAG